tara:strand:- start:1960 stop:2130 length:171 start_codon:yes stop_codon:yes gene_type:complete
MKNLVRSRKKTHKKYLEARIKELHDQLVKQVIEEGTVNKHLRKLLLKYHYKLNQIK